MQNSTPTKPVWACVDCYVLHCSGETNPNMSETADPRPCPFCAKREANQHFGRKLVFGKLGNCWFTMDAIPGEFYTIHRMPLHD